MNDDRAFTVIQDHLTRARDSLAGADPSIPASQIIATSRRRRTRRWLAATATACAATGLAVTLALGPGSQIRPVHEHLAAWSVDTNSNGTVSVTVTGHQLTHAAELQRALAQAGVPAIVTTQSCLEGTQNWPRSSGDGGVTTSVHPPGMIITPSRIPSGTKLVFSVIPLIVHGTWVTAFGWGLLKDGEPLRCTGPHSSKATAG
jgi:hypothetical protein